MDKVKNGFRRFYNNEVNVTNTAGAATAVRVNNDIPDMDFVFNTVRMTGCRKKSAPAARSVFRSAGR